MRRVLMDLLSDIREKKGRFLCFFIQMILVMLIFQFALEKIQTEHVFRTRIDTLRGACEKTCVAFQDPLSETIPDCDLKTYENFEEYVSGLCGGRTFSFDDTQIQIESWNVPDNFVANTNESGTDKYYPVTYISDYFFSYYGIKCAQGELFSQEQYKKLSSKKIPVVLGYDYMEYCKIGQIIEGKYQVVGFLEKGAYYLNTAFSSEIYELDDQIMMPMLYDAKEWGGCYINHLHVVTTDRSILEDILKKCEEYGFADYEFRTVTEQLEVLQESYSVGMQFWITAFIVLFVLTGFSIASTLLHWIDERKQEFGIHILAGATEWDISVRLIVPVFATILAADLIAGGLYGWQISEMYVGFVAVLCFTVLIMILPILYWRHQSISELVKRRD